MLTGPTHREKKILRLFLSHFSKRHPLSRITSFILSTHAYLPSEVHNSAMLGPGEREVRGEDQRKGYMVQSYLHLHKKQPLHHTHSLFKRVHCSL